MPKPYEEEYYGNEDAARIFKAPKKVPTPGEKLADEGGFLPDPEQEDLSQGVDYFAMAMDPEMRRVYDQDTQENIDFDKAVRAGELLEGVKIRQNKKKDNGLEGAGSVPNVSNIDLESLKIAGNQIKGFLPDPTNFNDIQEVWLDAKAFTQGAAATALIDGPLSPVADVIGGGAAVALRRLSKSGAHKLLNSVRSRFNYELLDEFGEIINPVVNLGDGTLARKLNIDALEDAVFSTQNVSKMTGSPGSGGGSSSDPLRTWTLNQKLKEEDLTNFLLGKGNLRNKEKANLIQEFADKEDFLGIVKARMTQLREKYPHLARQLNNAEETIDLRWHHVNPSKGPIDLYIGLTKKADRDILKNSLIDELGVFSGNHPLNNRGLTLDVHDQIHDWLGTRIGLRADVLKHKWAQQIGIDVGDLIPGTGFMKNHLTLSNAGKAKFDAWFKNLKPNERLPYIEEYGKIIKESEGILGDLMKQYDSLFAVPEGFRLTPDNEVLLRFLESIPTDGSRLLQKDIKAIVEQVNREMPRGTLDLIQTSTGRVTQLNLESDIYKRIDELKGLLDQPGINRRQINSYNKELKQLEKGILQKSLDIEGAVKQGGWNKRLEQERLRREGR